ncbi:putative trans-resveratrol di-O-methyltransferase-like isoform 1 [Capsicum annuum]|nr:putative trans-resveratrol di-O-methyltransferase-like isoform 1 [Capsicum annuum]
MFKLPKGKNGDKNLPLQRGTNVIDQSLSEEELEYLVDTTIIKRKDVANGNDLRPAKIAEFIICDDSIDFGFDKEDAMADDYVQHKGSECNVFNVVSPYISSDEFGSGEDLFQVKVSEDKLSDGSAYAKDKKINAIDDFNEEPFVFWPKNESKKEAAYLSKRLLKWILKCPSVGQEAWNSLCPNLDCLLSVDNAKISLRRANSKGYNVSFGE